MSGNQLPILTEQPKPSWKQVLLRWVAGLFVFETLSGLVIWLLPFSVSNQFMVLFHTGVGLLFILPFIIAQFQHFPVGWAKDDRFQKWLGVAGCAIVTLAIISGLVLTFEAALGTRINYLWHYIHLVSSLATIPVVLIHVTPLARKLARLWERVVAERPPLRWTRELLWVPAVCVVLTGGTALVYAPVNYLDFPLPDDYVFAYGDNPFAPSLAVTESGQPVAPVALNNSKSCGTVRCHAQIYQEWAIGSHRWSASDQLYQAVQGIMAREEGAHATRYCAGCHDPVSLLTGYKDAGRGLNAPGYDEGSSCVVCHGIREVDIQGNGNYIWHAPQRYAFENKTDAASVFLSEFLIRAYPDQHLQDFTLDLMRKPELCGACHKQFIDKEVNKFGWVQLQNQYDEWKSSHWYRDGDANRMLTCQRCHMRLVDSRDPARGDPGDPLRGDDGKHRNHRVLAANQFMPAALKLEGAQGHTTLVEEWLRGETRVPEIEDRWAEGPAVPVSIVAPEEVRPGERLRIRVNITNNKVGHSFPTGPLDLIESWIEFVAKDEAGRVVFHSGLLDDNLYVEPGSFVFKAEGIDKYGQLIDRHNLWDMVGARYKRSIFPGYTDTVEYQFTVPRNAGKRLELSARLRYRKVNQFFIDTVVGKGAFSTPITDMSKDSRTVPVVRGPAVRASGGD
ncbi:MAG: multiheme c-type cytochrome [Terriglobia bacterium]